MGGHTIPCMKVESGDETTTYSHISGLGDLFKLVNNVVFRNSIMSALDGADA